MKTKFYKRLVPIALIASMAVTNVGMTSASAQEVTGAVAGFTQSVEGVNVGSASIPASANVTFASASAPNGSVSIEITERSARQTDESKYELTDSDDNTISTSASLSGDTVTFVVPMTAFGNSTTITGAKVYYDTSNQVGGAINLTKTISSTPTPSPSQQSAPASGFQIPGGLVAKKDAQTGYTVGIAKVITGDTDLANNVVKVGDIKKSGDDKNVVSSTWADATAADGDYVLYYRPGKADDATAKPVFIEKLADPTKLPFNYKTKDNLTDGDKTAVGTNLVTALAGYVAKSLAATAIDVAEVKAADSDKSWKLDVPAVKLAATDALSKDNAFIDALIAAYNAKHTGDANLIKTKTNQGTKEITGLTVTENSEDGTVTYAFTEAGATEVITGAALDANGWENLFKTTGIAAKTAPFYTAVYDNVLATYLNSENAEMRTNKAYDLTAVQWVMETMKEQSGKDAKGKDVFSKASGSAKFWGKAASVKNGVVIEAKDASVAARVKGATALVSNTKAAGKFNAAVYLKAVKAAYTTPKKNALSTDNVIISEGFFVPPAVPSAFKTLDVSSTKAGSTLGKNETASTAAAASGYAKVYDLVLDVGKSYKLPFALADGSEKDLVYKVGPNSSGFTVVGGKVTATDENTVTANAATNVANTVEVYSRANPAVKVLVNVKVNASVKSVRANTTALAIWPGSEQTVSLGTVPATLPDAFKYVATCSDSNVSATVTGNLLVVKLADGKKASDIAKGATITVSLKNTDDSAVSSGGKEVKPLVIKLNPATAPQDVKSIKTAVKSKETDADGHKVINIPVGGAYNVGYSVSPATANGTVSVEEQEGKDAASVSGDVIKGENVGHEQIKFSLASGVKISDSFKSNEADPTDGTIVYDVNVYEPGSSIVLTDSAYTIKGGFLMTTAAADTDCNKTFIASKKYIMSLPKTACTAGDGEEIVWTANNPSAVKFAEYNLEATTDSGDYKGKAVGKYLEITPCQTGTFTITGTTKYTKQKLTFKMLVGADNEAGAVTTAGTTKNVSFIKNGEAFTLASGEGEQAVPQTSFKVGEKINAYFASGTENVGGPVTFELANATDKDKLVVAKTGLITAKGAGTVSVKAKMLKADKTTLLEQTFNITVTAADVTRKGAFDETKIVGATVGAAKGAKLSVALNNFDKKTMQLVWYTKKATDDTIELVNDNKNKLSGEVKPAAAGDYLVYVRAFKSGVTITKDTVDVVANDNAVGASICLGKVRAYAKGIKSADTNNGDKDTKTAIAALGAKVDENKPANAAGNGHTYYFPVFVKGTSDSDVPDAAKDGDMAFTVSNKSLAKTYTFIPKSKINSDVIAELKSAAANLKQDTDIVKNYTEAYGLIKVVTADISETEALSGAVTIKGTLVNSNKAVTIKLNLAGVAKDPAVPYAPVEVTKGTAKTDATFSGVTKLAGDEIANLQNALNEATGKTVTEYKWVIVKPNSKKYTKDDIAEGFTLGAVNVNETTKVATVATIDAASAVKEGTYYLAKETIIHKIKTAYVAASGDKEAVNAVEDTKAAKYTVELASKTPIVVSAATGGGSGTGTEEGGGSGEGTDTNP